MFDGMGGINVSGIQAAMMDMGISQQSRGEMLRRLLILARKPQGSQADG